MPIYIGNDLEDRLKALKMENTSLKKYNEYRQVVDEIDHTSDLHLDSSFYKQSMKLDNYVKINEWFDSYCVVMGLPCIKIEVNWLCFMQPFE